MTFFRKKKALSALAFVLLCAAVAIAGFGGSELGARAAGGKADNTIANTYTDKAIKMTNAPTVVADVRNVLQLKKLTAGKHKPASAILRFKAIDGGYFVVDSKNNKLEEFDSVYERLDHEIIPILHIENVKDADAVIAYLESERNILDMAVMSADAAAVKKVKEAFPDIRGIIEFSEEDFYTDGKLDIFNNIVAVANSHCAAVAVIPQSMATVENVRFIQGRFKTVWVAAASGSRLDLFDSVNSGAYGVAVSDFDALYAALESYPASTQDVHTLARMPFNVAHRGKFSASAQTGPCENSINAVKEAIACGATHLELDGHLTKDDRIVIMHDVTIDRTTTGTGTIANMTLAQIRQYKLSDGQEIPTLEDVFEVLEETETDIVLVLELKSGSKLASVIKSMIGKGENQYDVLENLVIISFEPSLLTSIKGEMPTTPTSFLNFTINSDTLAKNLREAGRYNSGLDTNYTQSEYNAAYEKKLSDRGFIGWYWTYESGNALVNAARAGYVGLTNNDPTALSSFAVKAEGGANENFESLKAGDTVALKLTAYDGTVSDASGMVTYCEKTGGDWRAIAEVTKDGITLSTQRFTVKGKSVADGDNQGDNQDGNQGGETPTPAKDGGCGCGSAGAAASVSGATGLLAAAAVITVLHRRKASQNK